MGKVGEVEWEIKMGHENNQEEIEKERLSVSFVAGRKKQNNKRNKSFTKNLPVVTEGFISEMSVGLQRLLLKHFTTKI